ncbi:response regulator [Cytophagaceae bacterium YF14B1]|uniref:Response regulator n=1 Tax=Xanthocytophaga flava TaxID=3048013 RepID=A0AAE3U8N1_9BACT|nr:response regulator [Xanthocytophaga flavus]MDJ1480859.1 response regulator [Xanthocytophaga flavus]
MSHSYPIQTALVVDDNLVDLLIAEKQLLRSGLVNRVIVHNSVRSVTSFLSQSSFNDHPQIMFLDLDMPYQNGFDFLTILNETPSLLAENCILYVLTSSVHTLDMEKVNSFCRVQRFLQKPMTMALLETVSNDLKRLRS